MSNEEEKFAGKRKLRDYIILPHLSPEQKAVLENIGYFPVEFKASTREEVAVQAVKYGHGTLCRKIVEF
jgi:hypothetical protein